jgi:hypothetical protein
VFDSTFASFGFPLIHQHTRHLGWLDLSPVLRTFSDFPWMRLNSLFGFGDGIIQLFDGQLKTGQHFATV